MQEGNLKMQGYALGIICLVSVVIRILFMQDWLNYDECQHFLVAKSPYWSDFIREFKLRAHPPLSYMFMKPFLLISSSAYTVKMLSFVSGITSIIIINFILQKAGITFWPAQIATLFLSMMPLFVAQSVEVRQYSLCLLFVWLSFYFYFRLYKYFTQKLSVHVVIALVQLLIVITEYSAIFHLLAFFIVVYVPLAIYFIRQKEWNKLFLFCVPQALVFLLALILFKWQFSSNIPIYGHTAPYLFQGNLTNINEVFSFFIERFPNFSRSILPNPWGMSLFALLIFPFFPLWKKSMLVKWCRVFSSYAILSVILVFIGSLFKWFPFGGVFRHTVTILPGILLSWILIIYMIISDQLSNKKFTAFIVTVICVALIPAYLKALVLPLKSQQTYMEIFKSSGFGEYEKSSGSIVANWRGRSILSWWLLPDKNPRQIYDPQYNMTVFNYGGTRVIQFFDPDDPDQILKTATLIAKQEGKCWIFLSFLQESNDFKSIHEYLKKSIQKNPNISLEINRYSKFNHTILIKINTII
jgi:hypothetical protein